MSNSSTTSKNASPGRAAPSPYQEGTGWAMRQRYKNNDVYVSGCKTADAAKKAVRRKLTDIDNNRKAAGRGADKTTLAQALQDYAIDRLPFLKGAVQEARRINHYLRYARLQTLVVTPHTGEAGDGKKKTGDQVYFDVALEEYCDERKIANSLKKHRKAQMTSNARTEKYRAVLATTAVSEVSRNMLQDFVDAMRRDGNAAATIALERSMLRVLFFYAVTVWGWQEVQDNPACKLKMPQVDNERKRVMSQSEQQLIDGALTDCRNALVKPVLTLLRETAMRTSEPLEGAFWKDVNWQRNILTLGDAKSGSREVPLSPAAIQALRELGPGAPDARIVNITYEALRSAWQRVCERAGVEDLHMHDLRRTAATRMALKTGNAFLVQSLTGHKSLAMVNRYIQVSASDVVDVMHASDVVDVMHAQDTFNLEDAAASIKTAPDMGRANLVEAPTTPAMYTLADMLAMAELMTNAAVAAMKLEQSLGTKPARTPSLSLVTSVPNVRAPGTRTGTESLQPENLVQLRKLV